MSRTKSTVPMPMYMLDSPPSSKLESVYPSPMVETVPLVSFVTNMFTAICGADSSSLKT
jgi:hypothetical protein